MKYICLGYMDEAKWDTMSESERNAFVDECFTYDEVLRKNGHFAVAKRCRALETPPHCGTRTARYPSPMVPSPKQKNNWVEFSCSKPGI